MARDQAPTGFEGILGRFYHATAARVVALVDKDGETVDYVGRGESYAVRVEAAELRLLLQVMHSLQQPALRDTREIFLRTRHRSFAAIALTEGYALILEFNRRTHRVSARALAQVADELGAEAGLRVLGDVTLGRWRRVRVRGRDAHVLAPNAVWYHGRWLPLTILGRHHPRELLPGEFGYLARLPSGAEFPLVCEASGLWFAEGLV